MKTRDVWLNISFAFAYFTGAWLTLLFSENGGYISPIWPSSGIALSAVLLYGKRLLPSVWFGSIAVNSILTDFQFPVINTLIIAFAVTIQAWCGRYLLLSRIQFDINLINRNDVVWFTFCAVLSTLIAASFSCLGLYLTGNIESTDLLNNGLTWWLGDCFGAILVSPIVLGILLRHQTQWQGRIWVVSISFSLLLAFTLVIYMSARSHELQRLSNVINQQFVSVHHAIDYYIESHINALNSTMTLMGIDNPINSSSFESYMQNIMQKNSAYLAISWNKLLVDDELDDYVENQKLQGRDSFTVRSRNAQGSAVPVPRQGMHVVVEAIYPYEENAEAIGIDVYQEPLKQLAIDEALEKSALSVTTEVSLIQREQSNLAILLFLPYLEKGKISGFITGVFDIDKFIALAFSRLDLTNLHVLLARIDKENQSRHVLYNSDKDRTNFSPSSVADLIPQDMRHSIYFFIGDQKVILELEPNFEWLKLSGVNQYWLILIPCLILISIIGSHILIMTGYHYTIQNLARSKAKQNLITH